MNKHFIFLVVLVCGFCRPSSVQAQSWNCEEPIFFCSEITKEYTQYYPLLPPPHCGDGGYWFMFEITDTLPDLQVYSPAGFTTFSIYGPFHPPLPYNACEVHEEETDVHFEYTTPDTLYSTGDLIGELMPGYYYFRVETPEVCSSYIALSTPGGRLSCFELGCESCVGSFAPEPGVKYLLSVWVREDGAALDRTYYEYPRVSVEFPNLSQTEGPFGPEGLIIEGWQRIEAEFEVPSGATSFNLVLSCTTGDCLFDDIRVHPFDGSMKTYVYDPVTLRLTAELDERNYATFYEYDEEGKLVRIKKETERGIMTIQETKTSVVKK